jgi:hypothetical protein
VNIDGLTEKISKTKVNYYENTYGDIVAKTCKSCGIVHAVESFSKQKLGLGGRLSQCKKCEAFRKAKSYNKESASEYWEKYYKGNKSKILDQCKKYRETNKGIRAVSQRKWIENNRDRFRSLRQRRRAREKSLPDEFTTDQMTETLLFFGGCALTESIDGIHWDHVIPLATGYGGTVYGNMIPLQGNLNLSKNDSNIFEWFSANQQRFNLEQERFDRLINWLASANAMSVEEYRAYVYECHANPNEIETKEAN